MKQIISYFNTILQLYPEEKLSKKIVIIITLLILGSGLEFLNLSLIIPFLNKMTATSASLPLGSPYLNLITERTLLELLSIILLVNTLKNSIQFMSLYFQNALSYRLESRLSQTLLSKDMQQDFEAQKQKNTAESQNEILNVSFNINRYFILPFMGIVSDFIVLSTILIFLFLFNPQITFLSLLLFSVAIVFYNFSIGKRYMNWGKVKLKTNQERLKIIQESLGAIVDITLLRKHSFFQQKFEQENSISERVGTYQNAFNQFPKFYFEFLVYLFLWVIIFYINTYGNASGDLILTLGVFAASLMKIIPSFNKLAAAYQSIKYSLPSLRHIEALTPKRNTFSAEEQKLITFTQKIAFENVDFKYQTGTNYVFENFSFQLSKNTSLGIVGESGKGKSTLINLLLGLLNPQAGVITTDGQNISQNLKQWQSMIGYVPQSIYLLETTLRENIAFGLDEEKIDNTRVKEVIRDAQLDSFIQQPEELYRPVGERGLDLSGGQVQRIGIARALYHNPEILIFDEATSALDGSTEEEVLKTIKQLSKTKTILMISHKRENLDFCNNIITLS